VTGLGTARLFDITCAWDPKPNRSAVELTNYERIGVLRDQWQALWTKKCMREKEAEMLLKYGETLSSEHVAPEKAVDYMSLFV
jgi:hypothetical protein